MGNHPGSGFRAIQVCLAQSSNSSSRRAKLKWLVSVTTSLLLLFGMYTVQAHILQTRMTWMYSGQVTQEMIEDRLAQVPKAYPDRTNSILDPGEAMFLMGDLINVVIKVIPMNGTTK